MLSGRFRVLCLVLSLSVIAGVLAADGGGDSPRRDEPLPSPAAAAAAPAPQTTDDDSAEKAFGRLLTAARANDAEGVRECLTTGTAKLVECFLETLHANAAARQALRETIIRKFGAQSELLKQLDELSCECDNCRLTLPQLFAGAQLDELRCVGPRRAILKLKEASVDPLPEGKPAATGPLMWSYLLGVRGRSGWKICVDSSSEESQLMSFALAKRLKHIDAQIQAGKLELESEVRATMLAMQAEITEFGFAAPVSSPAMPGPLLGQLAGSASPWLMGPVDDDSTEPVELPARRPADSPEAAFNQFVVAAAKKDQPALLALFTARSARKVATRLKFEAAARRLFHAIEQELGGLPNGGQFGTFEFRLDPTLPGFLAHLASLKLVSTEPITDERVKLSIASSTREAETNPMAEGPMPGDLPTGLFAVRSEAGWLLVAEFQNDVGATIDGERVGTDPLAWTDWLGALFDELAQLVEDGEVQSHTELALRYAMSMQSHVKSLVPVGLGAEGYHPAGGIDANSPDSDEDAAAVLPRDPAPVTVETVVIPQFLNGGEVTRIYKTGADGHLRMIESVSGSAPAKSAPRGTVETVVAPQSIAGGQVVRIIANGDDDDLLADDEAIENAGALVPAEPLRVAIPVPEFPPRYARIARDTKQGWQIELKGNLTDARSLKEFSRFLQLQAQAIGKAAAAAEGVSRRDDFEKPSSDATAQFFREFPHLRVLEEGDSAGTTLEVIEPPADKEAVGAVNDQIDTPQAAFERLQKAMRNGDTERILATLTQKSRELVGDLLRNGESFQRSATALQEAIEGEFGKEQDLMGLMDLLKDMPYQQVMEAYRNVLVAEVRELTPNRAILLLKRTDLDDSLTSPEPVKLHALKTPAGWKIVALPDELDGMDLQIPFFAKMLGLWSETMRDLATEVRGKKYERQSEVAFAWMGRQKQVMDQLYRERAYSLVQLMRGESPEETEGPSTDQNSPPEVPAATPEEALNRLEAAERAGDFEAVASIHTAAYAADQIAVSDPAEKLLQATRGVLDAMYLHYGPGDSQVKKMVAAFDDSLSKANLKKQLQTLQSQTIEQQETQPDGTVLLTVRRTKVGRPETSPPSAEDSAKEFTQVRKYRAVREGEAWKLQPANWTGPDGGHERRLEALEYVTSRYISLSAKIAENKYPDSTAARKAYDEIGEDVQKMMDAARK